MLAIEPKKLDDRVRLYSNEIKDAFLYNGVPFVIGLAFAHRESRFRNVSNLTGGDGARGGAWGIFQVTLKTARGYGFEGSVHELSSIRINAHYASKVIKWAMTGVAADDYKNIASRYNSGKPFDKAPDMTRNNYVPRFLESIAWAQKWIEQNGMG